MFRCDDVAALDAHLATHEVQRGDLEDLEGSKLLEFYDPDGNKLIAMQSL